LKKGSSGSLHTFENNEYSYKINLESINTATGLPVKSGNNQNGSGLGMTEDQHQIGSNEQSSQQYQASAGQKRQNYPVNNLFKEVIVEDEAEIGGANDTNSQ
jgi:hypothetical protein